MRCLQQDHREDLAYTLQQLLNVALFVNMFSERRYVEALAIVDDANILPRSTSEVGPAVQVITSLGSNVFIQRIIDDLITLVMECLWQVRVGQGDMMPIDFKLHRTAHARSGDVSGPDE
jgi:hypothetical protein